MNRPGTWALKVKHLRLTGGNGADRRAAARTIHGMDIDIVWLGVGFRVGQVKLHHIAHPDTRHRTRYRPIKTPEMVFDAVGNITDILFGFKIEDYRPAAQPRNAGRHVGGGGQFAFFFARRIRLTISDGGVASGQSPYHQQTRKYRWQNLIIHVDSPTPQSL